MLIYYFSLTFGISYYVLLFIFVRALHSVRCSCTCSFWLCCCTRLVQGSSIHLRPCFVLVASVAELWAEPIHTYIHTTTVQVHHHINPSFGFLFTLFLKLIDILVWLNQNQNSESMATDHDDNMKDEKNPRPLDEDDIALLKTYVCYVSNFLFSHYRTLIHSIPHLCFADLPSYILLLMYPFLTLLLQWNFLSAKLGFLFTSLFGKFLALVGFSVIGGSACCEPYTVNACKSRCRCTEFWNLQ